MESGLLRVNSGTIKIFAEKTISKPNKKNSSDSIPSNSKYDFPTSPNIRKNLPQTSILLASSPANGIESNKAALQEYTSLKSMDHETEVISMKGLSSVTVTKNLRNLITELHTMNPSCRIIKDIFEVSSGVYKYMYTSDLKRIKTVSDLNKFINEVMISGRHRVYFKDFHPIINPYSTHKPNAKPTYHSIDFLGPSDPFQTPVSETNSLKTPVLKTRKRAFHSRNYIRLSTADRQIIQHKSPIRLISYKSGSKVKEGTGGFKKPLLFFPNEKRTWKSHRNLLTQANTPKPSRSAISPSIFKEIMSSEEVCKNYTLTRQEFANMLSDYTYVKRKNKLIEAEDVAQYYSFGMSVFKALEPKFLYKNTLTWEEFVKIYMVIVLKRSSYTETLEFILNYMNVGSLAQAKSVELSQFEASSRMFVEKAKKILRVVIDNKFEGLLCEEIIEALQKADVSIYDLRILVGLIVSSSNNQVLDS